MYQRPRYYQARKQVGPVNYVMPFLIIIAIGIIGILVFNLWKAVFPSGKVKAAYMHIISGSAQMKAWGTDAFFNLSSDAVIMQGDQIRSSADAKLIVEFFDGSLMRVSGNSDVSFDSIDDSSKAPQIDLHLYDGDIWFNMFNKTTGQTDIFITFDNIVAKSNAASIFEVENNDSQIVRVFGVFDNEGLAVDILAEDGSKVVESESIGVGQQIDFTDEVLKRYWAYQSPTVLTATSDDFKQTDWYLWNIKEDSEPTQFEKTIGAGGVELVKVEPQAVKKEEAVVAEPAKPEVDIPKTDDVPVVLGPLTVPTLTSVGGGTLDDQGRYQVTGKVATLTGKISGADKVTVNDYTLQKFKPGDGTWTYFANADYGFMKAGENIYQIYGVDAKGNKSVALVVKVFYVPVVAAPVVPVAPAVVETDKATESEYSL